MSSYIYWVKFKDGGITHMRTLPQALHEAFYNDLRDGYVYSKKGKRRVHTADWNRLYPGGWENP